jgi:hypothetical protein
MAKRANRNAPTAVPPVLTHEQSLNLLRRQVDLGQNMLSNRPISSAANQAWETTTRDVLIRAYGSASDHIESVMCVGRFRNAFGGGDEREWEEGRAESMVDRLVIMRTMIEQLEHEAGMPRAGGDTVQGRPEGGSGPTDRMHFHNCIFPGGIDMSKQSVRAGGNISVGGNFVVADAVRESFNSFAQSQAGEDVKELVRRLGDAVVEMSRQLPADKQQEVAQDLNTVVTEASKETPRKTYIKLAGEGLMAMATAAGNVTVTGLVTSLLKHWGIGG